MEDHHEEEAAEDQRPSLSVHCFYDGSVENFPADAKRLVELAEQHGFGACIVTNELPPPAGTYDENGKLRYHIPKPRRRHKPGWRDLPIILKVWAISMADFILTPPNRR